MNEINEIVDLQRAVNAIWILVSSAMIFFMQAGFSLVESDSVRAKSNSNILIKNLFDGCIGAIGWYALGYGFAFGDDAGSFIGTSKFFGTSIEGDRSEYFMQWVF